MQTQAWDTELTCHIYKQQDLGSSQYKTTSNSYTDSGHQMVCPGMTMYAHH